MNKYAYIVSAMREIKQRQGLNKIAGFRLNALKALGGEPVVGDFRKIMRVLFPLLLGGTAGAVGYKNRDWLKKHVLPRAKSTGNFLDEQTKRALVKTYLMFQDEVPSPLRGADPRTLLSLPRLPE